MSPKGPLCAGIAHSQSNGMAGSGQPRFQLPYMAAGLWVQERFKV